MKKSGIKFCIIFISDILEDKLENIYEGKIKKYLAKTQNSKEIPDNIDVNNNNKNDNSKIDSNSNNEINNSNNIKNDNDIIINITNPKNKFLNEFIQSIQNLEKLKFKYMQKGKKLSFPLNFFLLMPINSFLIFFLIFFFSSFCILLFNLFYFLIYLIYLIHFYYY